MNVEELDVMQDNERRALLLTTSDLKGKAAHISLKEIYRFAIA